MHGKIRWELENFSRELPSYKHIMGFTLTKEELPRTALKKIKRYQVRNKYLTEKMPQAEIKEIAIAKEELKDLNQDLAIKIIRYISQQIKKTASLDSHLEIDLGIDSLSKVELFLGLETLFAIKIPDEMQRDASTVRDIIKNISDISERPTARIYKAGEIEKSWAQILRDMPSKEMLFAKITMQTGFLDKLISRLFKSIFLFIFRIFWRLRIERKGTLSPRGPYIICPNHASYLDGFILLSSLPLGNITDTFFLGYSQIFEHPLVKWSNKISRLIPVDSNAHLSEAMQAVALALAHKKIVCIFPEGRRSIDDNIGEFKKGVGILIKELDIPAVPVYIKGSHLSWPRGQRLPRFCPLKIIFGRPHSAKELLEQARKTEGARDDYEAIASALREEVFKLAC
jgi:long-chain acyl-CoA synthetase